MAKSIFEEVFDGPESIFGRIFGSSIMDLKTATQVNIYLTKEDVLKLDKGDLLSFTKDNKTVNISLKEE